MDKQELIAKMNRESGVLQELNKWLVKEKIEFSTCSDNRMNELDTITDINTNVYNSNRSKGHDIFIFPVIEKEELFYSYFLNLVEKNEELTSLKPVESCTCKLTVNISCKYIFGKGIFQPSPKMYWK